MASVAQPARRVAPRIGGVRRGALASVAGPTALAAFLCLFEISTRSLGFDEGASVAIAQQHGASLWHAIAHDGGNMSALYLMLHVLTQLFGDSEFLVRLPSAIAAVATVALTSVLALRLFGARVAAATGLLCAVSVPLVFWGQSARGYAPMAALLTASFLSLTVLLERVDGARSIRWPLIAYVLSSALAAYMGLVAVLALAAQPVVLAFERRAARVLAAGLGAVALCLLPLGAAAINRGSGQLFWVPRPNRGLLKQTGELLSSSGLQPTFGATSVTVVLLVLTSVMLIAAGAILVLDASRSRARPPIPPLWGRALVISWLAVPLALALAESFVATPVFVPRNLMVSLPAVSLLLGWGLMHPRVPALVGVAGLAVLIGLRAAALAPTYGVSPEDWRGATADVVSHQQARDCVAFYPADGRNPFRYYLARERVLSRAPRAILPSVPWSTNRSYVEDYASLTRPEVSRLTSGCRRLWLIWSHVGDPHGPPRSRIHAARFLILVHALTTRYANHASVTGRYANIGIALLG